MAVAIGALIGMTAWHLGRVPIAAIVMPMLIPLMRGRLGVYLYALGYHLAAVYGLMGFAAAWFNDSQLMGLMAWVMLSALAAIVWALFCKGDQDENPWRASIGVVLAFCASLLPPFALVIAGHPLVAWGYFLEGWGFAGVVVAILVTGLYALLWVGTRAKKKKKNPAKSAALMTIVLGVLGTLSAVPEYANQPGVAGINTNFGKPPANDDEQVERIMATGDVIRKAISVGGGAHTASTVVLPENTLSLDDAAFDYTMAGSIYRPLARAGKTAVVGVMEKMTDGFRNQAAVLRGGAVTVRVDQRQPALLSMWRPWSDEHFPLDWTRDTAVDLGGGVIARVLICYEEYIPALFLLDEIRGGHDLAIILSSNWSATSTQLPEIQRLHSLGMAKLFGRPVVRAVNYPNN